MKSFGRVVLIAGCCLGVAAGAAFAQSQTPGTNDPGIQKRLQNQERRIDQGVQSGELTPKEAEERMKSDGQLTGQERQRLHNMQDRSSQRIYRQKHDPQTANVGAGAAGNVNAPKVQKRMQNQERRIDQGVQSGELTPKEAGRLEAEQAKIQQSKERMQSDGQLTGKERQRLHNMQDRSSQRIYRQKHDAQKAPVKTQ